MTNLIFQHVLIIHIYICDNLISLTPRNPFGVYLHAMMKHAGLRYRIVSGRSASTVKEEVMFTSIKADTKLTSNFHSDQLVSNIIIRLQAREILNNCNASNKYKNSYLRTIYRPIKVTLRNSIISFEWIRKYSNKYQCLLEQQGDFLLDSSCWQNETDEGVTCLDYSETGRNLDIETHVILHQWQSYTMKDEIICLQQCWEKCLENLHSIIPAYKISIKKSGGKINFILLNISEYFRNMKTIIAKIM